MNPGEQLNTSPSEKGSIEGLDPAKIEELAQIENIGEGAVAFQLEKNPSLDRNGAILAAAEAAMAEDPDSIPVSLFDTYQALQAQRDAGADSASIERIPDVDLEEIGKINELMGRKFPADQNGVRALRTELASLDADELEALMRQDVLGGRALKSFMAKYSN